MAEGSVARFLMLSSILNSTHAVHFVQPQFVLGEENLILQESSDPGG